MGPRRPGSLPKLSILVDWARCGFAILEVAVGIGESFSLQTNSLNKQPARREEVGLCLTELRLRTVTRNDTDAELAPGVSKQLRYGPQPSPVAYPARGGG